ncbi:mCG144868, partial [Mus musculus]
RNLYLYPCPYLYKGIVQVEEVAPCLSLHCSLPRQFTIAYDFSYRGFDILFCSLCGHLHVCAHTERHMYVLIFKKIFKRNNLNYKP